MNFGQALEYLKDSVMVRRESWNSDITVGLFQPFEAGLPGKPSFFVTSKVCSADYIPTQDDGNAIDWEVPRLEVWWWPFKLTKPIEIVIRINTNGDAFLIEEVFDFLIDYPVWFYTKKEEDCYLISQQDGL